MRFFAAVCLVLHSPRTFSTACEQRCQPGPLGRLLPAYFLQRFIELSFDVLLVVEKMNRLHAEPAVAAQHCRVEVDIGDVNGVAAAAAALLGDMRGDLLE